MDPADEIMFMNLKQAIEKMVHGDTMLIISGEGDSAIWGKLLAPMRDSIQRGCHFYFIAGPMITREDADETGYSPSVLDLLSSASTDQEGGFHFLPSHFREPFHGYLILPKDFDDATQENWKQVELLLGRYHKPFVRSGTAARPIDMANIDGRFEACNFLHAIRIGRRKKSLNYIEMLKSNGKDFFNNIESNNNVDTDYLTAEQIRDLAKENKVSEDARVESISEIEYDKNNKLLLDLVNRADSFLSQRNIPHCESSPTAS